MYHLLSLVSLDNYQYSTEGDEKPTKFKEEI